MLSRLLTKYYIFGFVVLFGAMVLILIQNSGVDSPMLFMALRMLFGAFLAVIFFDLLRLGLVDEKTSYRSMLMERPLFNPRGKKDDLEMIYPLHPRFISVYFDHEEDNPYQSRVYSIQALRYEYGYYTDSLFLPLREEEEKAPGRFLTPEEANRLLTAYSRNYPLVVHSKDYAGIWLREKANSVLLTDSIDTEEISRRIYPKLEEYGIEDVNDWLRFEVDQEDPVYGAKITAAIYLDYLRLHDYDTSLTINPLAKEKELRSIYPEEVTLEAIETGPAQPEMEEMPVPEAEALSPAEDHSSQTRYIGPFTPVDEEGFAIPERGHLVPKEDE